MDFVTLPVASMQSAFLTRLGTLITTAVSWNQCGATRVDGTNTLIDIDTNQVADVIPTFTFSDLTE